MKAVILCAGYGERLKPLTNILPKPLFPILGRPLLEHIIYYLKQFGVTEIGVNTHWKSEKIIEYLGNVSTLGVKVYISYEPEILGIGGGIGTMREFLTDDIFIVHNGDVLSNIDIKPAIDFHIKEKTLCTLILHNYPQLNNVGVVSNNIVGIGKRVQEAKGSMVQELAYTGIAIMDKKILKFLPYKKPTSIIDIWSELIKLQPGSLKSYIVGQLQELPLHYWTDIGSIDRYLELHRAILIDRVPLISRVPNGNVYIGEDSIISRLAKISGFASIGNNCIIEDDVLLENCVVWDNVVVSKGKKLKNEIIYPGFKM